MKAAVYYTYGPQTTLRAYVAIEFGKYDDWSSVPYPIDALSDGYSWKNLLLILLTFKINFIIFALVLSRVLYTFQLLSRSYP
jgi:hypothetical protein